MGAARRSHSRSNEVHRPPDSRVVRPSTRLERAAEPRRLSAAARRRNARPPQYLSRERSAGGTPARGCRRTRASAQRRLYERSRCAHDAVHRGRRSEASHRPGCDAAGCPPLVSRRRSAGRDRALSRARRTQADDGRLAARARASRTRERKPGSRDRRASPRRSADSRGRADHVAARRVFDAGGARARSRRPAGAVQPARAGGSASAHIARHGACGRRPHLRCAIDARAGAAPRSDQRDAACGVGHGLPHGRRSRPRARGIPGGARAQSGRRARTQLARRDRVGRRTHR